MKRCWHLQFEMIFITEEICGSWYTSRFLSGNPPHQPCFGYILLFVIAGTVIRVLHILIISLTHCQLMGHLFCIASRLEPTYIKRQCWGLLQPLQLLLSAFELSSKYKSKCDDDDRSQRIKIRQVSNIPQKLVVRNIFFFKYSFGEEHFNGSKSKRHKMFHYLQRDQNESDQVSFTLHDEMPHLSHKNLNS